jgi:MYXO-CTERM domain-containing protein
MRSALAQSTWVAFAIAAGCGSTGGGQATPPDAKNLILTVDIGGWYIQKCGNQGVDAGLAGGSSSGGRASAQPGGASGGCGCSSAGGARSGGASSWVLALVVAAARVRRRGLLATERAA